MELIKLDVSEWGIGFTSYFGDVFIYWRSLLLVAAVVVVLRIAKAIRKKAR